MYSDKVDISCVEDYKYLLDIVNMEYYLISDAYDDMYNTYHCLGDNISNYIHEVNRLVKVHLWGIRCRYLSIPIAILGLILHILNIHLISTIALGVFIFNLCVMGVKNITLLKKRNKRILKAQLHMVKVKHKLEREILLFLMNEKDLSVEEFSDRLLKFEIDLENAKLDLIKALKQKR